MKPGEITVGGRARRVGDPSGSSSLDKLVLVERTYLFGEVLIRVACREYADDTTKVSIAMQASVQEIWDSFWNFSVEPDEGEGAVAARESETAKGGGTQNPAPPAEPEVFLDCQETFPDEAGSEEAAPSTPSGPKEAKSETEAEALSRHEGTGDGARREEDEPRTGEREAAAHPTQGETRGSPGPEPRRTSSPAPGPGPPLSSGVPAGADALGLDVWPGACALCAYLTQPGSVLLSGLDVLELGCGVGLPSLVAAARGAARVLATDYEPLTLDLLDYNAARNGAEVVTELLDWHELTDRLSAPHGGREAKLLARSTHTFRLVLAADVLYEQALVPDFVFTLAACLHPEGIALVAHQTRRALVVRGGEAQLEPHDQALADFHRCVSRVGLDIRVLGALDAGSSAGPLFIFALAWSPGFTRNLPHAEDAGLHALIDDGRDRLADDLKPHEPHGHHKAKEERHRRASERRAARETSAARRPAPR